MSDDPKRQSVSDAPRNFRLCVANGALCLAGGACFAAETILAGLAFKLTGSAFYVGILASAFAMGWLWPQVIVGSLIEHVQCKKPVYCYTVAARLLSLSAMGAVLLIWRGGPVTLYWMILALCACFSSAGGACVIPFMDIVAKAIPQQHMSMLFAYRRLIGGVLGFFAGGVVAYVLSDRSGIPYPRQYALLIFLGAVVCGLGYALFISVREPIEPVAATRVSFWTFLKRGPVIFRRDPDYRRLYLFRCFWAFGIMSQVLFVPFAVEHFDAHYKMTGWFSAIVMLAGGFSSLFWGRLSQRFGVVLLLKCCSAMLLLSPLTALALTAMLRYPPAAAWLHNHYLWPYIIMFGASTAAFNGNGIAGMVYLLALPPPKRRPTYIGFINTLTFPLTLTPMLAGFLVQQVSYAATFALACVASLGAVAVAFSLRTPSERHAANFEIDDALD